MRTTIQFFKSQTRTISNLPPKDKPINFRPVKHREPKNSFMNFLQDFRKTHSHSFSNQKSLIRHATTVWKDPRFYRHVYEAQAELERVCFNSFTKKNKKMKVKTEVEFVYNFVWINTKENYQHPKQSDSVLDVKLEGYSWLPYASNFS